MLVHKLKSLPFKKLNRTFVDGRFYTPSFLLMLQFPSSQGCVQEEVLASSLELSGAEAERCTLRPLAELCLRLVPFLSFGNVRIQFTLFLRYQKLVKIDCNQLCLASFNFLYFVCLYYTLSNSVSLAPCGTTGHGIRLGGCFIQKDPWGG